jgi:ectoine hydroxylase-related dioxygenase (phytanoyl-CoA dioxygenase family)
MVARLQQAADQALEDAERVPDENPGFDFEPAAMDGRRVVQRIRKPHETMPVVDELARSAPLLDVIELLIGPDIRLHHSKINVKAPGVGSPLEWHQDWAFVPHTNQDLAFVAVFIDDVPMEKGPLQLLPGSHRRKLQDHHHDGVFFGAIDPARLPLDQAVALTGSAGTISIHHPLAVHGSGHNRSTSMRRVLFYEYAAADAWPLSYGVNWEDYERRLVRGRSCNQPRIESNYVKMPYPAPAGGAGKIYAQQLQFAKRYFV